MDLLSRELLLVGPVVAHLWGVVESDTEELCEGVDIVRQAFLPVVLIYLLLADTVGQGQAVNIRLIGMIRTFLIVSPRCSGILKKIKQLKMS